MGKVESVPDVPEPKMRAVWESFPFPDGGGDMIADGRKTVGRGWGWRTSERLQQGAKNWDAKTRTNRHGMPPAMFWYRYSHIF